jgi:hypothetical protein
MNLSEGKKRLEDFIRDMKWFEIYHFFLKVKDTNILFEVFQE